MDQDYELVKIVSSWAIFNLLIFYQVVAELIIYFLRQLGSSGTSINL